MKRVFDQGLKLMWKMGCMEAEEIAREVCREICEPKSGAYIFFVVGMLFDLRNSHLSRMECHQQVHKGGDEASRSWNSPHW